MFNEPIKYFLRFKFFYISPKILSICIVCISLKPAYTWRFMFFKTIKNKQDLRLFSCTEKSFRRHIITNTWNCHLRCAYKLSLQLLFLSFWCQLFKINKTLCKLVKLTVVFSSFFFKVEQASIRLAATLLFTTAWLARKMAGIWCRMWAAPSSSSHFAESPAE